MPQMPTPTNSSLAMAVPRTIISTHEIPNPITHPTGIFLRVTIDEMWSVIDANKGIEARLGGAFKYGLFAFLAFTALWTFFLVRPYLKVPKAT